MEVFVNQLADVINLQALQSGVAGKNTSPPDLRLDVNNFFIPGWSSWSTFLLHLLSILNLLACLAILTSTYAASSSSR